MTKIGNYNDASLTYQVTKNAYDMHQLPISWVNGKRKSLTDT